MTIAGLYEKLPQATQPEHRDRHDEADWEDDPPGDSFSMLMPLPLIPRHIALLSADILAVWTVL